MGFSSGGDARRGAGRRRVLGVFAAAVTPTDGSDRSTRRRLRRGGRPTGPACVPITLLHYARSGGSPCGDAARPRRRGDRMRRREFIISAFAAATLARGAGAQPKPKLARVGWVVGASAASSVPFLDGLCAGLADLGYVVRRNLAI